MVDGDAQKVLCLVIFMSSHQRHGQFSEQIMNRCHNCHVSCGSVEDAHHWQMSTHGHHEESLHFCRRLQNKQKTGWFSHGASFGKTVLGWHIVHFWTKSGIVETQSKIIFIKQNSLVGLSMGMTRTQNCTFDCACFHC